MPDRTHTYRVTTTWTGNTGQGTAAYRAYSRNHTHTASGKPDLPGSSDPAFLGDPTRWNPEDLLLASLSVCHKLWYLALCAQADITVLSYQDHAEATMQEEPNGAGQFTNATLSPRITITPESDITTVQTP